MARTVLQVVVETDDDAYETTYGSRPDHEHGDEVKDIVDHLVRERSPLREWASNVTVSMVASTPAALPEDVQR